MDVLEVLIILGFDSLLTYCYGAEILPYQDGSGILHSLLGENSLVFDFLMEKCGEGGNNTVKRHTPSTNSIVTVKISGIMDEKNVFIFI